MPTFHLLYHVKIKKSIYLPCKIPHFKQLSSDAKLLYGIVFDRMGLSARNSWHDDTGQAIYTYTVKKLREHNL